MQPINNRCMTFPNHNIQTISFPTHNHLVITHNNASKRFSDRCLLNCHRNDCSFSHSKVSYEGIRALLDAICCAYRDQVHFQKRHPDNEVLCNSRFFCVLSFFLLNWPILSYKFANRAYVHVMQARLYAFGFSSMQFILINFISLNKKTRMGER